MKICKIKECQGELRSLGYCNKHYNNVWRHGYPETKYVMHGMYNSAEYRTWINMRRRCYNKRNPSYKHYGARGISVCDRWLKSFINFYEDMGGRPEGLTLDRIDNDGNYEPSNCRWATYSEQNYNNRRSRRLQGATV